MVQNKAIILIGLQLPTHGLGILDEDLTKLERLAINWENCHIAYYESMDFKEKIDKKEASTSTSQVFWLAFQDLCENILQSPRGDGDIFSACTNLQKRRQLRRGISLFEANLAKLTQHSSISIYSATDFKVEFELQAR